MVTYNLWANGFQTSVIVVPVFFGMINLSHFHDTCIKFRTPLKVNRRLFCVIKIIVSSTFTVPSIPPDIIAGFNLSSTSLTVEWSRIPPEFVNGILLGYMITYQISIEADSSQNVPIELEAGDELSKNITDLLVYTEYCVRVAGRTRIGTGNWSECFNITTDEEGKETIKEQFVSLY